MREKLDIRKTKMTAFEGLQQTSSALLDGIQIHRRPINYTNNAKGTLRKIQLACNLVFKCKLVEDLADHDYISKLQQKMNEIHQKV